MEQSQNIKIISAIVVVLAILGVGYILSEKYPVSNGNPNPNPNNMSKVVTVENTLMVGGILPLPTGFPQDIPLEEDEILESATTYYPNQNAKQLSVSYRSLKTITQKYVEYKAYMSQTGYKVAEDSPNSSSSVRTILGTKADTNLSVAISSMKGGTLVEISYLFKSL